MGEAPRESILGIQGLSEADGHGAAQAMSQEALTQPSDDASGARDAMRTKSSGYGHRFAAPATETLGGASLAPGIGGFGSPADSPKPAVPSPAESVPDSYTSGAPGPSGVFAFYAAKQPAPNGLANVLVLDLDDATAETYARVEQLLERRGTSTDFSESVELTRQAAVHEALDGEPAKNAPDKKAQGRDKEAALAEAEGAGLATLEKLAANREGGQAAAADDAAANETLQRRKITEASAARVYFVDLSPAELERALRQSGVVVKNLAATAQPWELTDALSTDEAVSPGAEAPAAQRGEPAEPSLKLEGGETLDRSVAGGPRPSATQPNALLQGATNGWGSSKKDGASEKETEEREDWKKRDAKKGDAKKGKEEQKNEGKLTYRLLSDGARVNDSAGSTPAKSDPHSDDRSNVNEGRAKNGGASNGGASFDKRPGAHAPTIIAPVAGDGSRNAPASRREGEDRAKTGQGDAGRIVDGLGDKKDAKDLLKATDANSTEYFHQPLATSPKSSAGPTSPAKSKGASAVEALRDGAFGQAKQPGGGEKTGYAPDIASEAGASGTKRFPQNEANAADKDSPAGVYRAQAKSAEEAGSLENSAVRARQPHQLGMPSTQGGAAPSRSPTIIVLRVHHSGRSFAPKAHLADPARSK
jgi:hypothetical protein